MRGATCRSMSGTCSDISWATKAITAAKSSCWHGSWATACLPKLPAESGTGSSVQRKISPQNFWQAFARSIFPAFHVGTGGSCGGDVLGHIRQDAQRDADVCVVGPVRPRAGKAMRRAGAVIEYGVGMRAAGLLQIVFHQVHGLVQEISVRITDCDVNFPFELRTELRPIAMQNRIQVVVLAPVIHHGFVDVTG